MKTNLKTRNQIIFDKKIVSQKDDKNKQMKERKFHKNKFSFKLTKRNLFKSKKNIQNFTDMLYCLAACSN